MDKTCLRILSAVVIAMLMVGCGGEQEVPEPQQVSAEDAEEALRAARADSVAMAQTQYNPSVFDTIAWGGGQERFERGELVWSYSCTTCHGTGGRGDGELAVQNDLSIPNFTAENWAYGGDIPAIRHRVYIGHESEMPSWGLYGLPYRDVDAVAFYVNEVFRRAR
jgi:mono/diheme cytochrome c family protein